MDLKKACRFTFRRWGLWLVAVGVVCMAGMAVAKPGHRYGRQGFMGGKFLYVLESLDLTEKQELELLRLRRSIREQRKSMHLQALNDAKFIAEQLKNETPDRDAIVGKVNAHTNNMQQMAQSFTNELLDFHGTLTAEQKKKLSDQVDKFIKRRESRFNARQ